MDLAISLLNYNTKNLVKQCVKNIVESPTNLKYEIIIADNHSTDGSVEFIKKKILPLYPQVKLAVSATNRGFGGGHNFALEKTTAPYILIINPDITVLGDSLTQLHNFLASDHSRGIVAPKLIYPDLTTQSSCHPWPKFLTPLYRRTFLGQTPWGKKELIRYDMQYFDYQTPRQVDWLVGACLLIKKEVWDKIGGFDQRFFLYYEDVDLCRKCASAGYQVWYYPEVKMIHYHKRLSAQKPWWTGIFDKSSRIHLQSHWKYFVKWGVINPRQIKNF
ncbi:MAG: hypothetical protein A2445_05145 [Candidatus Jacksonbacteria bacterium RIFOXYC2_FULL_44_29]|nr:MAG: hypothetical protein UW45_C0014G0013 [Parcubacteria group bacterium GW2011_GWC2_44_22]OGY75730.1 MAG: hypothetical protein A2240_06290 [Candidatus Jacksonbacteria bacterium RIFOXYA2_FULL_43_12]OGY76296.1 MAG: hypothetical protein A2295_00775 [Candidatus Jacksonbacteria bacterium RIFOXYB2_FULL_44_15]OGY78122.1 MAG: hypothetical protein A2445_05145 [Candidatus Jacksonbacteria bacterium RIFOXYC2_FULL_44_29]OGY80969.1 MAG: hypothetical protein A2550_02900 [Candidatus Jacksonbacteria bacteri